MMIRSMSFVKVFSSNCSGYCDNTMQGNNNNKKNYLTFPNCSKYCFTSSTTVLADKPPTNIFFVLVTIWKEKGQKEKISDEVSNALHNTFNEPSQHTE